MFAVTAMMVGGPAVGLATPTGAASNANRCLSINGYSVVQSGTAICISSPSGSSEPNVARATGANSVAEAVLGNGDTATANGDGSLALAVLGNGNTATANGNGSGAAAGTGDRNTATANGNGSGAVAGNGTSNTATANGHGSSAVAGTGDNNTATANGPCRAESLAGNMTDTCRP
jgi:hypothetical protein